MHLVDVTDFSLLEGEMTQNLVQVAQSSSSLSGTPYTLDDDDDESPNTSEIQPFHESSPNISEVQPVQKKKRLCNFSVDEDIALISTWLNTSFNPRKGTDKKGKGFWIDISQAFCRSTKIERTERSLNCRFEKIQKSVNKFIELVAELEGSDSGYDEHDKIQKAKSMYLDIEKSPFRFEHCWNILRNEPKWKETNGLVGRKKRTDGVIRSNNFSTPPSPVDLDNEGNLVDLDRKNSPTIPSSSVDLVNEGNFIDLEGFKGGTKAAEEEKERQRKRKLEHDNSLGGNGIIPDWSVQKRKMHDDNKTKVEQEKMAIEKLRMEIEQEKMAMAKRDEEFRIMTMDLSNLDNYQKEYIMILRANILDKTRNNKLQ